jgi:DNA-binding transcriptional ArsR family regulator
VVEILGIFTRVLDGRRYESDTGAQGHRGYSGEYMFVWIGAAVEISRKVHKYLSTLGPKLYFFRIPKLPRTEDQYFEQIKGMQFQDKVSEVQSKLEEYLDCFNSCPVKGDSNPIENFDDIKKEEYDFEDEGSKEVSPIKILWDETKDEEKAIRMIIKLANLLAHLRGILTTWETRESQGTEYSYSLPIIEEPDRAITQLRNLARGAALIQGRNYVTIEDISLIIKVVLSNASIERVRILDLLLNAGGKLSTSEIEFSLNISKPTARRTMAEFKGLGIVDLIEGKYENSEIKIKLKPKFSWFLGSEFKALRDGFTPDFENDNKNNSLIGLKEKCPP